MDLKLLKDFLHMEGWKVPSSQAKLFIVTLICARDVATLCKVEGECDFREAAL